MNPSKHFSYDGVDVDPLEAMFVKFKHSFRAVHVPYIERALAIERALNASALAAHSAGGGRTRRAPLPPDADTTHGAAAKQVCMSQAQTVRSCFNASAYAARRNEGDADGSGSGAAELGKAWGEYLSAGQFRDVDVRCVAVSGATLACPPIPLPDMRHCIPCRLRGSPTCSM
jgi:hypothetical protein